MQQQIPVIYFHGTSPGRYQPIIPTFIMRWHPEHLRVQLGFGMMGSRRARSVSGAPPRNARDQSEVVHQASFRDAVLSAYGGRCAISHQPEPRLPDAAHIVMDADGQLAQ